MPFQPNDRGVVSQECTPMLNPCQHRGQLARRGKVNDANHRNHPHQNHPPATMFVTTLPDTCNGTGLHAQQPVRGDRSGTNRTACRSVGGGNFFTAARSSPTILCRNGCCRQDRQVTKSGSCPSSFANKTAGQLDAERKNAWYGDEGRRTRGARSLCVVPVLSANNKKRRGKKTRIYYPRSWTLILMVCLLATTLLMVDMVQAVFVPVNKNALKAAVNTCLRETGDGSCPTFAASNDATGKPYGLIGDWDVSSVTSMYQSKCNLSPSV